MTIYSSVIFSTKTTQEVKETCLCQLKKLKSMEFQTQTCLQNLSHNCGQHPQLSTG